jgi:ABC-type lipoprotein release transport system permease subunit
MTLLRLLWLNLAYHWRGNLAVLLGVVVGGTVLTGALLVGDSLQGSLRAQSERRLGWVEQALTAPRFFRQALAEEVSQATSARVSPALLLQGTCAAGEKTQRRELRGINVLGLDPSFFAPAPVPDQFATPRPLVWVNRVVAEALHLREGDQLDLRLEKPGEIPREAGLGKKDVEINHLALTVAGVLAEDAPGANFNIRPELQTPRNILVSLPLLQDRLGLPGQVNALLAAGNDDALREAVRKHLTLEDWGLVVRTPSSRARDLITRYDNDKDGQLSYTEWLFTRRKGKDLKGKDLPRYAWVIEDRVKPAKPRIRTEADLRDAFFRMAPRFDLESKQLLIAPTIETAALEAARKGENRLRVAPTLVYLCRIQVEGKPEIAGVVAALDPTLPPPLGPFLPEGKPPLRANEIVLLDHDWQPPQRPAVSSPVVLRFKPPESHGPTPDQKKTFTLSGFLPPHGPAADPTLTPDFPGITDQDDTGAWKLPFDDEDWSRNISREYGDPYWRQFRATPKAYIDLERGQELWGSRFGNLTSIRFALPEDAEQPTLDQLEAAARRYSETLLEKLDPPSGGFVFDPVRASAEQASQGAMPFGLLFLGFSVFLILSALLLVGLLYRLNLDRRASQVGLLFAEGYRRRVVRRLFAGEGGLLAAAGVVAGCCLALLYARFLLWLLATLWPDQALRSFLAPYASPLSVLYGGAGTLVVAVATVVLVVWGLGRVPPRELLAGRTTQDTGVQSRPSRWPWIVVGVTLVLGVGLLIVGPRVPGHEAQAGTFFGSGSMFLTAGLVGLYGWMKRGRHATVEGHGGWTIARLGVRNAARNALRSLLTVGLLASAAFLLVAVESFRRRVPVSDGTPRAADGGFALVAESDLPLIRDPGSEAGHTEILTGLQNWLTGHGAGPQEIREAKQKAADLLGRTTLIPLRARTGDDISCLTLYKPRSPRVLGVPATLLERGGFVFEGSQAANSAEKDNPWLILTRPGESIPAFGEKNTVEWILQKSLGKEVTVPDDKGRHTPLVIAGLLHDSVFQSSLLVSEERFLQLYPGEQGYRYLLITPPAGQEEAVKELLERAYADRGLEVSVTAERIAAYLAVENTYLTTFQALGGLGLVLGSLGLAVVLLRAVWERQAELALLRAMGWRRLAIGWLVLAENSFLLLAGLGIGSVAALLSILPQLLSGAGAVPVVNLSVLFVGVLVLALLAGSLALASVLRAPLVPALRRE